MWLKTLIARCVGVHGGAAQAMIKQVVELHSYFGFPFHVL
jgi:hypothetical protein